MQQWQQKKRKCHATHLLCHAVLQCQLKPLSLHLQFVCEVFNRQTHVSIGHLHKQPCDVIAI